MNMFLIELWLRRAFFARGNDNRYFILDPILVTGDDSRHLKIAHHADRDFERLRWRFFLLSGQQAEDKLGRVTLHAKFRH